MKDTQNEIESLKQGSPDINRIIVDDFIHNDDSINTITAKIAKALGINETSHKELFLYGKYSTNFQLNHFYDDDNKRQNTSVDTKHVRTTRSSLEVQ